MKLYLSSQFDKDGPESLQILRDWAKKHNRVALIPNAKDMEEPEKIAGSVSKYTAILQGLGFEVSVLDLKDYFNQPEALHKAAEPFRTFFALGGGCYTLRQAMKLSGFDDFLHSISNSNDYLYAGFSASAMVLAKNIDCLKLSPLNAIDNVYDTTHGHCPVDGGLGFIDYMPVVHYDENMKEHRQKRLEFLIANNRPHRLLRDGKAIVVDTKTGHERFYPLQPRPEAGETGNQHIR
ncbi:MAG: peptidase E [Firmicutes bacterium]|nr:peptidase E [Bacillota bacterium]